MFDTLYTTRGLGSVPCRAEIEESDRMQEAFLEKNNQLKELEKKINNASIYSHLHISKGRYQSLQEDTEYAERKLSQIKQSIEVYKEGAKKYREYILKLENALNISSLGFFGGKNCDRYTKDIERYKKDIQRIEEQIFHRERDLKRFAGNFVPKEQHDALLEKKNQMEVEYRELTEQVFKPLQEENRVLSEQYKALKDKLIASGATGSDIDYILKKPLPPEAKQILKEDVANLEYSINQVTGEAPSGSGGSAKKGGNSTMLIGLGTALLLGFLIYKRK
ncbi:hypothetical protein CCAND93_630011 [Capnocytophaga canis]|uniref:Uncharacterized protein n=2 Tax=Capnocytophaga canis TaxID=1848903 RepID=A0A0B7ITG4_9FLAO|nr:hypothetical protein CCAND93_630011 [Capnocytophaga canis]